MSSRPIGTDVSSRNEARSLCSFLRGDRGSVLTWSAFLLIPLIGFIGVATDAARGYMVRARMSQALDAAALAAGRTGADQTKATTMANTLFRANFPNGYMDAAVTGPTVTFDTAGQKVNVSASAVLPTYFVHLIGVNNFTVSAASQVTQNAINLEIAMILDVTGSMNSVPSGGTTTKISDLRTAASNAIDILIWDDQSQYYSKVAMIPWSNGVNVGAYAAQLRGAVPAGKTITAATQANPIKITTSTAHGFQVGDKVFITGVNGMTQINNTLEGSDNPTCSGSSCTKTASPAIWVVQSVPTSTTFTLKYVWGSNADGTQSTFKKYTSGGTVYCASPGCQYYAFQNTSNTWRSFQISTCVTERTGTEAYTDASPSTALLGRQYPPSSSPCLTNQIMPLTNDKTALKNAISVLQAAGSTAGQVGTAWAWYPISPNFASLWPAASRPAAYGTQDVLKIAIFMTDGSYNSPYCNGVIAKDATSGSGSSTDHINCNATNGDAYSQARSLCDAMKAKGIIIYTVGFDLDADPNAKAIMDYCASDAAHAYLATDGAGLDAAFRAIAVNIRKLRISQ